MDMNNNYAPHIMREDTYGKDIEAREGLIKKSNQWSREQRKETRTTNECSPTPEGAEGEGGDGRASFLQMASI